jgi:hypothetical protein
MISQSDSDSTENHFLRETEMFMFLSESGTVPNALIVSSPVRHGEEVSCPLMHTSREIDPGVFVILWSCPPSREGIVGDGGQEVGESNRIL